MGSVHADPARMQQVASNLLSNAVKFTPSGGQIRVRTRHLGTDVELEVTDTGIGMQKDFLPHVFERFRQAETGKARQHAGLGLGLAIAKQLVELHGGKSPRPAKARGAVRPSRCGCRSPCRRPLPPPTARFQAHPLTPSARPPGQAGSPEPRGMSAARSAPDASCRRGAALPGSGGSALW